jgi:hypothetical protein
VRKNENMPLLLKSCLSKKGLRKKGSVSLLERTQSLKEVFLKNGNSSEMIQADYIEKMMKFR